MMGEEEFQLHVASPTYAICPTSYKARQETSWCTWSFLPAGASQISHFKILPLQPKTRGPSEPEIAHLD